MPSCEPGKMYILFPCPGTYLLPSNSCSEKGEPDAKSTDPPLCSMAFWNVHSARLMGLDSGKMMGRGLRVAIALMMSFVKAP